VVLRVPISGLHGALHTNRLKKLCTKNTFSPILTGITCLAPRPTPLSGLTAPALPFSRLVWVAVIASAGAGALLLWLLFRRHQSEQSFLQKGPLDCAILMLGFMLMVPVPKLPTGILRLCLNCFLIQVKSIFKYYSTKCIITFFFKGFLLATCYSSSLVSFMTVPRFERPIDSAKHLAERSTHILSVNLNFNSYATRST